MTKSAKEEAEARAQASFKRKEDQKREGKLAMAEYEAAGHAMREKTAKLRALRLAKEAADAEAAKNAPPKPAPKEKPAPVKAPGKSAAAKSVPAKSAAAKPAPAKAGKAAKPPVKGKRK